MVAPLWLKDLSISGIHAVTGNAPYEPEGNGPPGQQQKQRMGAQKR